MPRRNAKADEGSTSDVDAGLASLTLPDLDADGEEITDREVLDVLDELLPAPAKRPEPRVTKAPVTRPAPVVHATGSITEPIGVRLSGRLRDFAMAASMAQQAGQHEAAKQWEERARLLTESVDRLLIDALESAIAGEKECSQAAKSAGDITGALHALRHAKSMSDELDAMKHSLKP